MVIFDRDGTLNVRRSSHVHTPGDVELLSGAGEAVALAASLGRVVIVTNQQSVGRGEITPEELASVNKSLTELLGRTPGANLDAIYVCPHLAGTCECRKPGLGLFRQALADAPDVDAAWCAVVGDQPTDVQPGLDLGMLAFHVVENRIEHSTTPPGAVRVSSALEAMTALAGTPGWSP